MHIFLVLILLYMSAATHLTSEPKLRHRRDACGRGRSHAHLPRPHSPLHVGSKSTFLQSPSCVIGETPAGEEVHMPIFLILLYMLAATAPYFRAKSCFSGETHAREDVHMHIFLIFLYMSASTALDFTAKAGCVSGETPSDVHMLIFLLLVLLLYMSASAAPNFTAKAASSERRLRRDPACTRPCPAKTIRPATRQCA
nr:hypothetical protein BaRGS_013949 [Batillaria attramentaria]